MAFTSSTRLVNPRLGKYFAIFASAFAAVVLMMLMLEQLGVGDILIRAGMFAAPLGFFAAIGVGSRTREAHDYLACGRRVPAFFNGLVLAVTALGGAAFLALTGSFFMVGFDALCLSIGLYAGLVFMAVLFAPFFRKSGAYTVPSYLGRRFDSRMVRVVAAAVVSVPILLLLAAETRLAAYASAWLLGQPESLMAAVVVSYATVVVIAGGMRSLTWSSVAKGIAAILALAVLATIIAVMLSNLPLPQLTHGNMLRVLTRMEIARGVPIVVPEPLTLDLPGTGIEPIAKRFLQTFGGVGSVAFLLMSFIVAAGVAASPVLLPRCGTTPGVYESRKSLGWAVLIVGLVLLTLPAIAVYLRAMLVEQVVGQTADHLPAWFQVLQRAGVARLEANVPVVALGNVGFERDAVLFALPIAGGFPQVLIYLALAGALAASLAALAAALLVISTILAEDVVHGLRNDIVPDGLRIGTVRIAVLGAAVVTVWLAMAAPADPLQLFLYALTFTAAACFPVLLLSIWWKRINAWGALASMIGGFAITAFVVLLGETGASPLPGVLAAAVGAPVAIAIAVVVSLMTPVPGRNLLDVVREIRIPGGETIHDRELRLQRLKNRGPA